MRFFGGFKYSIINFGVLSILSIAGLSISFWPEKIVSEDFLSELALYYTKKAYTFGVETAIRGAFCSKPSATYDSESKIG